MLTIAKMHGESVSYYESTVIKDQEQNLGPDGYYSEDGTRPVGAWTAARTDEQAVAASEALGSKRARALTEKMSAIGLIRRSLRMERSLDVHRKPAGFRALI